MIIFTIITIINIAPLVFTAEGFQLYRSRYNHGCNIEDMGICDGKMTTSGQYWSDSTLNMDVIVVDVIVTIIVIVVIVVVIVVIIVVGIILLS